MKSACACIGISKVASDTMHYRFAHLGSSDKLPGAFDAPSLSSPCTIEPHIPCELDPVLQVKNSGDTVRKMLMARAFGFVDIRDQHLDIPITTKPAFALHFANMADLGTAEKSTLHGLVLLAEFGNDGNEMIGFIFHLRVPGQFTVCRNLSLFCGVATFL